MFLFAQHNSAQPLGLNGYPQFRTCMVGNLIFKTRFLFPDRLFKTAEMYVNVAWTVFTRFVNQDAKLALHTNEHLILKFVKYSNYRLNVKIFECMIRRLFRQKHLIYHLTLQMENLRVETNYAHHYQINK